jgi:hypothetical protein
VFNVVLADAGVEVVVLTGVRMPRMNAVMERWAQTSHRELLDRIWSRTNGTCSIPPRRQDFQ